MADTPGLLSDQWHLVAGLRVTLRPDCAVRRQVFRGRAWQVVSDPYTNRHFRVRSEAWAFVARLDRRRTVDEVWRERVAAEPETAPGQREVVTLLTQLHGANLLLAEEAPEAWSMAERRRRERFKAARQQVMNFLFLRIPLFDPDPILQACRRVARVVVSPWGFLVWLGMVVLGGKTVIDHWDGLREQTQGVLAPGNLALLYVVWAGVKVFHELGHGFVTKRYGGEVRTCGLMLLVFTPVPYVDASAASAFRSRGQRMLVGAAGMVFEVLLAAVAALVWARVGGEGAVGQVAYNIMFLASVSTLLFNLNPLLRFDGYYILADAVGVPNLHRQANQQWRRWFERTVVGVDGPPPVAPTRREAAGLAGFGAAAAVYRVFVLVVIVAFLAGQAFELGVAVAVFGAAVWLGGPVGKFYRYLATDRALARGRGRAWTAGVGVPVAVLAGLAWLPMPQAVRAPGVVEGGRVSEVYAGAAGRLAEVVVASGAWVEAGAELVRLENPDLEERQRELAALRQEVEVRRALAWSRQPAVLAPLEEKLRSLEAQGRELAAQEEALTVRAPHAGRWTAPELETRVGGPVPRGADLGRVRAEDELVFDGVVRQRDVERLNRGGRRTAEVRLRGAAGVAVATGPVEVRPAESRRLPSAALGWRAGGPVEIDSSDEDGVLAAEPFYRLRASLPAEQVPAWFLRTGVIRVALPPEPWGVQGWRRLRQFIQERYGR